jgi:hypothetical protein
MPRTKFQIVELSLPDGRSVRVRTNQRYHVIVDKPRRPEPWWHSDDPDECHDHAQRYRERGLTVWVLDDQSEVLI